MKKITVTKNKDIDEKSLVKKSCLEGHAKELIDEECVVYEGDKPIIAYIKLDPEFTKNLRWAMRTVKFHTSKRSGGLTSTSTIFGFSPRRKVFKDCCCATGMSESFPKAHAIICGYATKVLEYYKKYFPEIYEHHKGLAQEQILPDWLLPGGVFTSGICNENNALGYHFDSGNFKHVLSNMIVLREGKTDGGHLVCPSYNIKFKCDDNYLVIFDGQSILHGVSPILLRNSRSKRYSVVFYTLQQMCHCLPPAEEIKRVRKAKLETEKRRLDPAHNQALLDARFKNRENPGYQPGIYSYKKHGGKKKLET